MLEKFGSLAADFAKRDLQRTLRGANSSILSQIPPTSPSKCSSFP